MPIHASHNFTENFLNAIGSGDEMMVDELVIDELARLLVENKREVVDILRKNNVNASIRDKDEKLAQMVTKYLSSDPKIRFEIANLVKTKAVDVNRVLSFVGEFKNADAKATASKDKKAVAKATSEKKPSKFIQNVKSVISDQNVQDSIVNTIMGRYENTFDIQKTGGEQSNLDKNTKILQERVKLAQMQNGDTGGMSKGAKIAIIGTAIALLIGGIIALIIKAKGKSGDNSPLNTPTPTPAGPPVNVPAQ